MSGSSGSIALALLGGCSVSEVATPPASDARAPAPYHPAGFAAPERHGAELKLQVQDCRTCHGAELTGNAFASGSAPSCDGCHVPSWRTGCTFCHGGIHDATGAPPRWLDGAEAAAAGPFPEHGRHVAAAISAPFDCVQCHVKPTDVLSPGHVFDPSHRAAENVFSAGLAPETTYDGDGGCATLYCHGSGRAADGAARVGGGPLGCDGCHASLASPDRWAAMSGGHEGHLGEGDITCADCHTSVTTDNLTIAAPALHVDRLRQVAFAVAGMTYAAASRSCSGPCHGAQHDGETWTGRRRRGGR